MDDKTNFTISGKVCAVTGGASGIGLCFVNQLLEHDARRVYILDFNVTTGVEVEQHLQKKYGVSRVKFIQTNVVKEDMLKEYFMINFLLEIFDQIIAESQRLDILMNNAGTLFKHLVISVNLMGAYHCLDIAIKHMSKANGGSGGVIINTASNMGLIGCISSPLYSASKHGVIGLTRSYAHPCFYEESGIRVMAICPNATETPLLDMVKEKTKVPVIQNLKGQIERELKLAQS
ncbi:15-hydroxyprostaglandin dehydrogenase [NAD(+)]-like [Chrysoperla carnea]|uniref:15-hydroxyprostaglandin dehydrogenase [NAD(+)]-like n=1 Tax=Chrysoperla carnea TaxID=189513 RepID=UPI001D095884|nr:15-hydroxyprostaglandin dehydrogenase [NAD(+)]-like [Chrysoperla carnea]